METKQTDSRRFNAHSSQQVKDAGGSALFPIEYDVVVDAEFASQLESKLEDANISIAELNQRLIERQESFQVQLVRIEDVWREKLREAEAELKAARNHRDEWRLDASTANEYIKKLGKMLGCEDGETKPELQIEVLNTQIASFHSTLVLLRNFCRDNQAIRPEDAEEVMLTAIERVLDSSPPRCVPLEDAKKSIRHFFSLSVSSGEMTDAEVKYASCLAVGALDLIPEALALAEASQ